MKTRAALGKSLRQARKAKGLTQEDFGVVSSRTYVSSLERGLKTPTLDKIEMLAKAMKIHPLTLLVLTYLQEGKRDFDTLMRQIAAEIDKIKQNEK